MECDATDPDSLTAPGEFTRAVGFPLLPVVWKERAENGERTQHSLKLTAKTNDGRGAGCLTTEAHNITLPVDVLGSEVGDVRLSAA